MNFIKKVCIKCFNYFKKIIKFFSKYRYNNLLTKNNFLKKISKYDIISFDIFDTLITRTIFNPDDIFLLMQEQKMDIELKNSIINMRKNAEYSARKKLKKDVNLDEIYNELGNLYEYDDETVNMLKQLEIDFEYKLTYPRKDMLKILEKLVDNGKKIILVSDMYLDKNIIEKLLNICGYEVNKHYHEIYLSNELNKRKDDGSMWKYICEIYNKNKFIHVGDNIESDYNIPLSLGVKCINIDNPREQLKKSQYGCGIGLCIDNRSISDSLFLGYLINEQIFNSPFSTNISELDVFSKTFTAPMIYSLIEFVYENTNKNDKLLFLAREGYNLERLYDAYISIFDKQKREHFYFLSSRKAAFSATIFNKEDLKLFIHKEYHGTIKSFLHSLFDIEYVGDDFEIRLPEDYSKVEKIVLNYSNEIIGKSKTNRENYIKYISSIYNYKKETGVIVDLGYSGTIQYHLTKMLNKEFKGLYLTNSDTVKRNSSKSQLLFAFDITENDLYKKIYTYSLILEFFLSAPYGQLQYFENKNNKINPVYNDEIISKEKNEIIGSIYESIIDFMERMKEINDIYEMHVSKELLCSNYISLIESNIIDKKIKDKYVFVDSFNDSKAKNLFISIDRY